MKKAFFIILFFLIVCLSGCKVEHPVIVLNSNPITKNNIYDIEQTFGRNKRVYYAVLSPKGFKDSVIRVQIIKKDEKTQHWGYSIYDSQEKNIDTNKKFYLDYFITREKGYYIIQIFELRNLSKPIARNDFWVFE